jgi:hypothetical protein
VGHEKPFCDPKAHLWITCAPQNRLWITKSLFMTDKMAKFDDFVEFAAKHVDFVPRFNPVKPR